MTSTAYTLPSPVLWTETLKFTDVLEDDPRRLLITDICYANGSEGTHLDGKGGSASHMYAAQDVALHPGLWVVEADAMDGWGVRCYRSRIRLASKNWQALHTTVRESGQGVDAGMVTYSFAKPGDVATYEDFVYYNLAREQMIWVFNEFGSYRNPHIQGTPRYDPEPGAGADLVKKAEAEGWSEEEFSEKNRALYDQAREAATESLKTGFVTATTGSGDGDGGYPVLLTFLGERLVQAETWFAWVDEDEEGSDD